MNWVSNHLQMTAHVIERSIDGTEYEPVGLKEGIGFHLVVTGSINCYRIITIVSAQIDNEVNLLRSDPKICYVA
jgi:hypothetical protein